MPGLDAPETGRRIPLPRVEQELRLVLRRATAASAELARRVHPDLEASAYPLLMVIRDEPGVHATELAQRFGIGRATISRQLSRLEDLEIITRTVDPADSRGQLISLTAVGTQRISDAQANRLQWLDDVLTEWPDDDVDQFADLLARYSASVEAWRARQA
ncbi:MarR family winged helix-turn-helix transcriptional regulator [Luteimicrobium subarcticum]|uniref:MarR family transcriptional regulator n=1 Tax=Luteimicrobium subarcticum TaxID=620910 RepID=A0A2M8WSE8_9MICO|nr:MarR family transcriptional regulator [Luteimicrobium subarcticum]PJI93861.1 MarR family transcriptional regulator [Luteimicrobium subarcticum]